MLHLLGKRDKRRRRPKRRAAVLGEGRHEAPRIVRLGANERRDRVERIEEKVRLDLSLNRRQLGRRAGPSMDLQLARLERRRDKATQRLDDGALAIRDRQRTLKESDHRTHDSAAHHERTDDRRTQWTLRIAAVLPANGQSRYTRLGHCLHRAGRSRRASAMMVGRKTDVGQNMLSIRDRHRGIAQPLLCLSRQEQGG